jgi:xylulokinase
MIKPRPAYVLGSDLGTSGCKCIIMDASGSICGWAIQDYPTTCRFPGWAEQNPQDWFKSFLATSRQAIRQAGIEPAQIAMICIDGITHNAVLLDEHNQVLRPSILYTDGRATSQTQALLETWGERIFQRTWNQASPIWTWPQLMWISEHEPHIWGKVKRILFPKDYVRYRVVPEFLSDTIDPAGTLLYDPVAREWVPEFYESLGLRRESLPLPRSPFEIIGAVQAGVADHLRPGTPVVAGTTDTAAEVFGVGALHSGQATIKLATVGRITAVSPRPLPNPAFLNYPHILEGLWYPGSTTKFAASAYSWARRAFWDHEEHRWDYKCMDQIASDVSPGAEGILFHPYLAGEFAPSWDPHLRASFLGIGINHTRAHFTRAVMEGVGFAIRDALQTAIDLGLQVHEIRLLGGGAESELWAQIITDIINREVIIPVGTDAAFGAALMAGIAAGMFENTPQFIDSLVKVRARLAPHPARVSLYEELFGIYREAANAVKEVSHRLHDFQMKQKLDPI